MGGFNFTSAAQRPLYFGPTVSLAAPTGTQASREAHRARGWDAPTCEQPGDGVGSTSRPVPSCTLAKEAPSGPARPAGISAAATEQRQQ